MVAGRDNGSASYRLRMRGQLATNWEDYITLASVALTSDEEARAGAEIAFEVIDQAQLLGVLALLASWGATLLWVRCDSPGHPPARP